MSGRTGAGLEEVVRGAVRELSAAFHARDLDAVLACFAPTGEILYAGSEPGEWAAGREEVTALLAGVLARDEAYSFAPGPVRAVAAGGCLHAACETAMTVHPDGGREGVADYRICGVLEQHGGRWRWRSLTGSEPVLI